MSGLGRSLPELSVIGRHWPALSVIGRWLWGPFRYTFLASWESCGTRWTHKKGPNEAPSFVQYNFARDITLRGIDLRAAFLSAMSFSHSSLCTRMGSPASVTMSMMPSASDVRTTLLSRMRCFAPLMSVTSIILSSLVLRFEPR